ncbi:unnamed protein product [Vicia faba]|uniref:Uncharacterized protein n=1 Tax=Vicia faba TaxID=3906 RepID=A0AAV1AC41_VICFA|nr:unnamed protein product [Vicia faba]
MFVSLIEISLPLNKIDGTIGDGIVNLANLTVLELYPNQLTGSIPKDIGKLLKLEKLLLHVNNLTGTIPPAITLRFRGILYRERHPRFLFSVIYFHALHFSLVVHCALFAAGSIILHLVFFDAVGS